jgi:proteasome lid subunit RPN8/RPN11
LIQFHLGRALHAAIVCAASATPELEVCGLLGGTAGDAKTVYPVDNASSSPETSFCMEPRGQLAAMRAMRQRGEELVGIYHSHPHTPPRPSAKDRAEAAYPGVVYLIVSLSDPGPPEVGCFLYDGARFSPVELILED